MTHYYMTLGGIRQEISPERAAQIRNLQKMIAEQRKSQNQQIKNSENAHLSLSSGEIHRAQ